ncbi:MAG: tRNA dihydrouridine(20/20a) synthase DusA [Acidobacteriota bacterium]
MQHPALPPDRLGRGTTRPLSVAPMMDRTDRHFRFFLRRISRRTLLYTEMVTTGALLHGDIERHLAFDSSEHPIALQLGGDDPTQLARCAQIAEARGYDEVNLNVGCPSDRVQRGRFGACLMAEPERVARAVEAMRAACSLPVTVKHRLGIDSLDRYEDMLHFVDTVAAAGCDRFSVHARKAWLSGLSPKENRNVPPLRYERVHRLKRERPDLTIEINGDIERHLAFDSSEHPIALQLGGDDPTQLARCAQIAEARGYDEVNLNVGCPSDRVQRGRFGACLMAEPERVARAVEAMRAACSLPVTVKHRLGIDSLDRYEDMLHFVDTVAAAGCDRFSVHARKAWLSGLSPKENRNVPPLRYERVHRLKRERPDLTIEINGGILDLGTAAHHLEAVDAVMIGRAAWDRPFLFADADRRMFGSERPRPNRREIVEAMVPYAEARLSEGVPLHRVTRPMLQLFAGQPGARRWRRHLSQNAHLPGQGPELLLKALARVDEERDRLAQRAAARPLGRRAEPSGSGSFPILGLA